MPPIKKKKRPVKKTKTSKTKKKRSARKDLAPNKEKRGLGPTDIPLSLTCHEIAPLTDRIQSAGGVTLGAYREPLSGHAIVLATLPLRAVAPTPFQRDLSPTHSKRLASKIEEAGAFLDPLIVVMGPDGEFWTPNGRHRLAAAKFLGLQHVTVLISTDEHLAFRILALNTEKAHNLKDRSLEAIRMAKELAARRPRSKEASYGAEFEAPELLTLGSIYLENKRFAGGAYRPFLRKTDRFSEKGLAASLRERDKFASRLLVIDDRVREIIADLQDRGFKSPYLRTFVVAKINPVRWIKTKRGETEPVMPMSAALTRMLATAKRFDASSVRAQELALVAAVSTETD